MMTYILPFCLPWLTLIAGFIVKSDFHIGRPYSTVYTTLTLNDSYPQSTSCEAETISSIYTTAAEPTLELTWEYLYIAPSLQVQLNTSLHTSTRQRNYSGSPSSFYTESSNTGTYTLDEGSEPVYSNSLTIGTILATTTTISQFPGYTASFPTAAAEQPSMASKDIFAEPIGTKAPPSHIKSHKDHPVPRTGITARGPLQTNKFFANFHLGDRHGPTFTFPYSLAWAGGKGASGSWGMSCSHVEAHQRVFGKEKVNGASSYYLNPVGIQSLVVGAADLGKDTILTMDSITAFSTRVHLSRDASMPPAVSFPIVQGMAYITALYSGSIPRIQTGVYFKTVTRVTKFSKSHVTKFNFNLEDGTSWRLYAYRTKGDELELEVTNNTLAQSKKPFFGSIHIAKDPKTTGSDQTLDDGAGVYPVSLDLTGTASGEHGSYSFNFQRQGHELGNLYMYALPHHVESFDQETTSGICKVKLQTKTKGLATLVQGSRWTMVEKLPLHMDLAPWHPDKGNMTNISDRAKGLIHSAAQKELS